MSATAPDGCTDCCNPHGSIKVRVSPEDPAGTCIPTRITQTLPSQIAEPPIFRSVAISRGVAPLDNLAVIPSLPTPGEVIVSPALHEKRLEIGALPGDILVFRITSPEPTIHTKFPSSTL